ncbi:hypothetical protein OG21DRAFT_683097 [Imleria badia]|nr:hypothetical protein OG21DRAFT_683097 [Imleria badia]
MAVHYYPQPLYSLRRRHALAKDRDTNHRVTLKRSSVTRCYRGCALQTRKLLFCISYPERWLCRRSIMLNRPTHHGLRWWLLWTSLRSDQIVRMERKRMAFHPKRSTISNTTSSLPLTRAGLLLSYRHTRDCMACTRRTKQNNPVYCFAPMFPRIKSSTRHSKIALRSAATQIVSKGQDIRPSDGKFGLQQSTRRIFVALPSTSLARPRKREALRLWHKT